MRESIYRERLIVKIDHGRDGPGRIGNAPNVRCYCSVELTGYGLGLRRGFRALVGIQVGIGTSQ
jgi:hypothetical protein